MAQGARDHADANIVIMLVGNKSDLRHLRLCPQRRPNRLLVRTLLARISTAEPRCGRKRLEYEKATLTIRLQARITSPLSRLPPSMPAMLSWHSRTS